MTLTAKVFDNISSLTVSEIFILLAVSEAKSLTFPFAQRRCNGTEANSWLAPFHRICTPMQSNKNVNSRMITAYRDDF